VGQAGIKRAQELLSNDRVSILKMRGALYDTAAALIAERGIKTVVCIYDPTCSISQAKTSRAERKSIGNGGGDGYVWLNSAIVDPESRRLLGVAHQALVSEKGPDDAQTVDYAVGGRIPNCGGRSPRTRKQQFLTHARMVDERLRPDRRQRRPRRDREFDDGLALRSRLKANQANSHFVIRGLGSRWCRSMRPIGGCRTDLAPPRKGKARTA